MNNLNNIISLIRKGQQNKKGFIVYKFFINNNQNNIEKNQFFCFLNILRKQGFIRGFLYTIESKQQGKIIVYLKYDSQGNGLIQSIYLISKKSNRIYLDNRAIYQSQLGLLSVYILSTSQGLKTVLEARLLQIGGEVLCCIN